MMFNAEIGWKSPPQQLVLARDAVHVWRVGLDVSAFRVEALRALLSADELVRAHKFYFAHDRERFITGRGRLRIVLGHYLQIHPHMVRFCYWSYGKPLLVMPPGREPICFNVSHSEGLALFAVACGRAIGVDLERFRDDIEYDQIATRFFSPAETASLRDLPLEPRETGFFACWTRKEAFIKAQGVGLSSPLDQFTVTLAPGEPARLVWVADETEAASGWSLQELAINPGYRAALAVEGGNWRFLYWNWAAAGDWGSAG